ncbi:MAG: YtxH domain-containing protein [Anaerolineae bacterium]|jgi:gas vesicle protein|nr:YtxH domain-containing protein [Anaerolineae bacterium]
MRRLSSWLIGLGFGAAVGAALVLLFAPASGQQISAAIRQGWADTLAAARQANAQRQAELEAELTRMQQRKKT